MRRRSSKQDTNEGTEIDKLSSKLKEEPQLSGAYIRSLVKQLTSSRTEDPMNPKGGGRSGEAGCSQKMAKLDESLVGIPQTQQSQEPHPHKKQVRRRLHTSRPYQERLLNMAEARREIVTALKFHRAAMKQANEQRQKQEEEQEHHHQTSLPVQPSPQTCFEPEGKLKSRRNPRIYPSNSDTNYNYLESPRAPPLPPAPSYPFPWPNPPIFSPTFDENFNFPLPNQTLGLNLNFQDFTNLDITLYQNSSDPSPVYSSSSFPSLSSSPSLSIATEELPSAAKSQGEVLPAPAASDGAESCNGNGLHQVMDDVEMAKMRSLGEQHQVEWNDTMNLATSAWWFKFLKTMEIDPEEVKTEDIIGGFHPFEEAMEFSAWLNPNDVRLQQQFDDYPSQEYFHDPDLPRMDIGDIDGMDGDWLS